MDITDLNKTIELDVFIKTSMAILDGRMKLLARQNDCTAEIVSFMGPNDGYPRVRFSGLEHNLKVLLRECYYAGGSSGSKRVVDMMVDIVMTKAV
jgi:hypothetical protein